MSLLCRNNKRNKNTSPDRVLRRPFPDSDIDLDYTRKNVFGQPTIRQTGIDAIFDPIDADTPEFFDFDPKKTRVFGPNFNS